MFQIYLFISSSLPPLVKYSFSRDSLEHLQRHFSLLHVFHIQNLAFHTTVPSSPSLAYIPKDFSFPPVSLVAAANQYRQYKARSSDSLTPRVQFRNASSASSPLRPPWSIFCSLVDSVVRLSRNFCSLDFCHVRVYVTPSHLVFLAAHLTSQRIF